MKCSKSGSHLTDEDRFLIEKHWNVPDGRRHPSIRAVAKALGLSEATLRREPKRGCAGGKYCMMLMDKGKRRWQYFPYSAEAAKRDAGWEKGAVENLNRIIRFFYPRPTDFSKISRRRIKALRRKLTAYPRPTKTRKAA